MTKSLIQKIVTALLLIFLVSLLTFTLMQLLPGDPAHIALGERASEEQIQKYREAYGLNKQILIQFFNWFSKIVFHGDFGKSILNNRNVTAYISERLPNSISIGLPGIILGISFGLFVGIVSTVKRGSWLDQSLTFLVNPVGF